MKNSYIYTGKPIRPSYTLNIGDKHLESGKDFDIEYTDNINVGTAHVLIQGKGKYKGTVERSFEITPVPARSLSFYADNTEFEFDGEPCMMQVAVCYGDMTLEEGEDYTVAYVDNDKPGRASVQLTFMGNYTGVMTIPFSIVKSEDESERLINLSEISAEKIIHGESVYVTAAAQGGQGEYTYAVFYKKESSPKWSTVHGYNNDITTEITPKNPVAYKVCIKAKDKAGTIAKKYFDLMVTKARVKENE